MPSSKKLRIAAVADIHCTKSASGVLQPMLAEASAKADVLLLCGDLTDYGLPEEAHALAKEIASARLPIVAVLGNHDFESGKAAEVTEILCAAGMTVLDGEAHEIEGVGFAGAKGFAGGFGDRALPAWGEPICKAFVEEAVGEALKLERALARLSTPAKIVLLHYSPISATVEGEPPEIHAWLGSSRLEEPLARYPVAAVFHGHAHHGSPQGTVHGDTPVFNVSVPILRKRGVAFHLFEVARPTVERSSSQAA